MVSQDSSRDPASGPATHWDTATALPVNMTRAVSFCTARVGEASTTGTVSTSPTLTEAAVVTDALVGGTWNCGPYATPRSTSRSLGVRLA